MILGLGKGLNQELGLGLGLALGLGFGLGLGLGLALGLGVWAENGAKQKVIQTSQKVKKKCFHRFAALSFFRSLLSFI